MVSCTQEHLIAGGAVRFPELLRLRVEGADFPLRQRVALARFEALLLLVLRDVEVVLEEADAGADEHVLEAQDGLHELVILRIGTEAHDALDAGAVVPGAVEQHELARGGQVRHVTLEVPCRLVAVGGFTEGDDARLAGAEMLREALNGAVFAGGVAALEDDEDAFAVADEMTLQLDQLDLEIAQEELVLLVADSVEAGRRCYLVLRGCHEPRIVFAAATMCCSAMRTSSSRRVLRPQSGFTHTRSRGSTATAWRRRSAISSVGGTRGEWMS